MKAALRLLAKCLPCQDLGCVIALTSPGLGLQRRTAVVGKGSREAWVKKKTKKQPQSSEAMDI